MFIGRVEPLLPRFVVSDGALKGRELLLGRGGACAGGGDQALQTTDLGLTNLNAGSPCSHLAGQGRQPFAAVGRGASQGRQPGLLGGIRGLGLLTLGNRGGQGLGGGRDLGQQGGLLLAGRRCLGAQFLRVAAGGLLIGLVRREQANPLGRDRRDRFEPVPQAL